MVHVFKSVGARNLRVTTDQYSKPHPVHYLVLRSVFCSLCRKLIRTSKVALSSSYILPIHYYNLLSS